MKFLQVRNWARFQHYKDRNPPWIKFYTSLVDDWDFNALPDTTRLHLLLIWLLAARQNNRIPYSPEWVRVRINTETAPDLEALVKAGFLEEWQADTPVGLTLHKPGQDASKHASNTASTSMLASERERERQRDRKKDRGPVSPEDEPPEITRKRESHFAQREAETLARLLTKQGTP